jgi:hypothetical protein
VCVFAPKLYVVLLQPHKNVRQGASMYNNSYKSGRQSSFGSFPLPCPNGIVVLITHFILYSNCLLYFMDSKLQPHIYVLFLCGISGILFSEMRNGHVLDRINK